MMFHTTTARANAEAVLHDGVVRANWQSLGLALVLDAVRSTLTPGAGYMVTHRIDEGLDGTATVVVSEPVLGFDREAGAAVVLSRLGEEDRVDLTTQGVVVWHPATIVGGVAQTAAWAEATLVAQEVAR